MSMTETEAKRLARQSGIYVDMGDGASRRYVFHYAENGLQGEFAVQQDGSVTMSYSYALPDGIMVPKRSAVYTDPAVWREFWRNAVSPNAAEEFFETAFDSEQDAEAVTEAERVQKVRVGQDLYRRRLEELWGGACAVTGIRCPELLRASHAKPWAECRNGAERLSPFNGFLLNVALDALFDRHLITFDEQGTIVIAESLDEEELRRVGIDRTMKLRRLDPRHEPFLAYHRAVFSHPPTGKNRHAQL